MRGQQDHEVAVAAAALGVLAQIHLREHEAVVALLHAEDEREVDDVGIDGQLLGLLCSHLRLLGHLARRLQPQGHHALAQLVVGAHVQRPHLEQVAIVLGGASAISTWLPFRVRRELGSPHLAIDSVSRLHHAHVHGLGEPAS